MNVLAALEHTTAITGRIFPLQVAHVARHLQDADAMGALESAFRFSLAAHVNDRENSRWVALHELLSREVGFGEFVAAWRRTRRTRLAIYKEPFFAFAPDFLHRSVPEALGVHIFRDGRDCADSLARTFDTLTDEKLASPDTAEAPIVRLRDGRRVPWWVPENEESGFLDASPYLRNLYMWRQMIRTVRRFEQSKPLDSRILSVRYEDLMRQPIEEGQRILDHIDCAMNREVRRRLRQAHPRSIGIHRRRDFSELSESERIAGEELSCLGYSVAAGA